MDEKYLKLKKAAARLCKELSNDNVPWLLFEDGLVDMYDVSACEQILNDLKSIYKAQIKIELSS